MRGYIEEAKWREGDLRVTAVKKVNCGVKHLDGDYRLNGQELRLIVAEEMEKVQPRCHCEYPLTFEFQDFPAKDYLLAPSWSEDRLLLKPDGTIEDACTEEATYDCYKRALRKPYELRWREREPVREKYIFTFERDEDARLITQYPEFLEFFKKHAVNNYSPYCNSYHFALEERPSANAKRKKRYISCNTCGVKTSIGASGNTFEEAVQDYIKQHIERYGPGSFVEKLSGRLGVPISYISSRKDEIQFAYREEHLRYRFLGEERARVTFLDRLGVIFFTFSREGKELAHLSRSDLLKLVDTADRFYQLMNKDPRLALPETRNCVVRIDAESEGARFKCRARRDSSDPEVYVTIHNQRILVTEPVKKKFQIDLARGEITERTD